MEEDGQCPRGIQRNPRRPHHVCDRTATSHDRECSAKGCFELGGRDVVVDFCFLFFVVDFCFLCWYVVVDCQVSQVFAVLDAYPHARAIRDILLNDYVEQVVARVLGPERVLWFLRECLVLGGHEYYRANVAEGKHWQDLWSGWVAPKKSKKQRGRGGASSATPTDDSDTSLTGQYVKPTSPETPEPPSLTKVGKQFWDVPEL